jgi:four helix bundle protein
MEEYKDRKEINNLTERLLDFAAEIIKLLNILPKTSVCKYISVQLMRSGTSPGANYEEACGAESRADFIHKMGIVLKELKESRFWLRLIKRTKLIRDQRIDSFIQECQELCAITAKSIFTARKNK